MFFQVSSLIIIVLSLENCFVENVPNQLIHENGMDRSLKSRNAILGYKMQTHPLQLNFMLQEHASC